MSEHLSPEQKQEQQTHQQSSVSQEEVKPDKKFSFIFGIFIGIALIVLYVFLFPG